MSLEEYKKLWTSPKLDMSKMLKSYVKSHTTVSGVKGSDDCIERLEFLDGTMMKSKVHHSDYKESI